MSAKRSSAPQLRKKPDKKKLRSTPSKTRGRGRGASTKGKSKLLANLGLEDASKALFLLAERHPELVPEIEDIIRGDVVGVAFEDVANKVVDAIEKLTIFDLGRSQSSDPFRYEPERDNRGSEVLLESRIVMGRTKPPHRA